MPWSPQNNLLQQLHGVLRDSISDKAADRLAAQNFIDGAKQNSDLNCYLVYILAQPSQENAIPIRSSAGLLLKNNIRQSYSQIGPEVMDLVKKETLHALRDQQVLIRSIAGNVLTTIISQGGILSWPEVLPELMTMLEEGSSQEGAFSALSKVCEDSANELNRDYSGQRPLDFMIPKFLQYTGSPNPRVRADAIFCLNQFILQKADALFKHIDTFLASLFQSATDDAPEVRKNVCQAIVLLLDARPDKLVPSLPGIVEYMLHSTQDGDEAVALEACEFWLEIGEQDQLKMALGPYLPKVIPVLLAGMVYSDMDLATLGGDEDDSHVADRDEDIRPQHAHAKAHTANGNGKPIESVQNDEGEEVDEFDDDEDDDEDFLSEWNLRKCSAAALDVLSGVFGESLLQITLPYLKQRLLSDDWLCRESGVLALGAIADGCMDYMVPHLPDLYPYLIHLLEDPKPLLRQITCWTLGRYSKWAAFLHSSDERSKYFLPLLEGLLKKVLDNNKRVQEAGCSALANLEEQAGQVLVPYLDPILRHYSLAFQKYQHKNLLILYDAVQTLADNVGHALNRKEFIDIIMPPLIGKWRQLSDDDQDLFPLLECLSSVTVSLGSGFVPFAPPVFSRCVHIVHQNLAQVQAVQQDPSMESPDMDFVITALDLLSGLVQGLGSQCQELVASSQPSLLQLISVCLTDPVHEVRQSAYALIGDLTMTVWPEVKPFVSTIMPELLSQIQTNPPSISVCNNAAWAGGEIALQLGTDMEPFAESFITRLLPILCESSTPVTISENAAIALGRLGLGCPDSVAPHLPVFAEPWCRALAQVQVTEEKDSAFRGMCTIIGRNPGGLSKCLVEFLETVGSYSAPSTALNEMFHKVTM